MHDPASTRRPRVASGTHARALDAPCLELVVGDVTAQDVGALVTATGHGPRGMSAVELAVRRRAGAELEQAYARALADLGGDLPVGTLVVTEGFALRADRVIHCRPPSYDDARADASMRALGAVTRAALDRADDERIATIAIASLGTGAYGFPARIAAPSTVAEIARWLSGSRHARLARIVVFGPHMLTEYAEAAMRVLPSFVPEPLPTGGLRVAVGRGLASVTRVP